MAEPEVKQLEPDPQDERHGEIVHYICNAQRSLRIASRTGRAIRFDGGHFATSDRDVQAEIERNDQFGVSIHFQDDPTVTRKKIELEAQAKDRAEKEAHFRAKAEQEKKDEDARKAKEDKEAAEKKKADDKRKADEDATRKASEAIAREKSEKEKLKTSHGQDPLAKSGGGAH